MSHYDNKLKEIDLTQSLRVSKVVTDTITTCICEG
ncbi:hypothetical protein N481_09665 [Pseudoalteromonas luteoviolacea S4047-1]|uniref:Uncharacterized protein n=1 Tax=Pseudoalteromonas luteoviolacea S4054 TaxID=1129367 RepID=A0A0F6AFT1_9GAMM|nr:hypothetical protein N479_08100 [Pseudoalteromonas luteoviolacea S4054]KZN74239.1 hypothetical protein N481_09665 [Pseudoalteromonas luteoviolacea S4047-1]